MEKLRLLFSAISWLVSLAVGLAILYTFLPDSPKLDALARETACGEGEAPCDAFLIFLERSSFARSYRFFARDKEVAIHCERRYVVFGDYACVRSSEGPLFSTLMPPVLAASALPAEPTPPAGSTVPAAVSGTPARKRAPQPNTSANR